MAAYSHDSLSSSPTLVARVAGPCEKWKEHFVSQQRERVGSVSALGRGTSPLYTPNHLSFKGMFMFSHFSPPIVLKETEPMRRMFKKFLCALQCTWWFSLWPDLLKVQDSGGCLTTLTQLCGGEDTGPSDAVMSYRERANDCPSVTQLGNQKVIGK